MTTPTGRTWSALTLVDDERTSQGNDGYEDEIGRCYLYDSRVSNSRHVREGDLILLRDRDWVLGVGLVERVESAPGEKVIRRCRSCGVTRIKARKTMSPIFRCEACGEEFDEPITEVVEVTLYEAHYESHWEPCEAGITVKDIDPAYLRRAKQHAIRELSTAQLLQLSGLGELVYRVMPSLPRLGHDPQCHEAPTPTAAARGLTAANEHTELRRAPKPMVEQYFLRRDWAASLLRFAPQLKAKAVAKIVGLSTREVKEIRADIHT